MASTPRISGKETVFVLKACPRCNGDLYSALEDELVCIQCGKELNSAEKTQIMSRIGRREERKSVATQIGARRR